MEQPTKSRFPFRKLLGVFFALMLVASACSGNDASEVTDTASGGDMGAVDAAEEVFEEAEEAMEEEAMEDAEFSDISADLDTLDSRTAAAGVNAQQTEAPSSRQDETPEEEPASEEDTLGNGGPSPTEITAADIGRKIIFTARVVVDVDDVAAAGDEATKVIDDVGGFVSSQNTVGGNEARSEITFKVLPENFGEALERLGNIGELRNQSITSDDVTERVVNLASRIEVAQLGVDRLRAALENATTLEDYADLERLLLARESDLEVMRGQLRTLQDRVDLATITLVLTQDQLNNGVRLEVTTYEGHDDGASCPGEGQTNVETGTPVTLCFEVTNTGEQTLTNIVITDTVLEITGETSLIEVFGELEELAPGQSALVAFETVPERTIRPRPRVSAVPVDEDLEVSGPAVSATQNYEIRTFVVEVETDPGFGDGFSAASDILKGLWIGFTVILGFLIPLLVILIPLAIALMALRRWIKPRRDEQKAERAARTAQYRQQYAESQTPPAPTGGRTTAAAGVATATATKVRSEDEEE